MLKRLKFALPIVAIALLAGLYILSRQPAEELPRERLALMTSLPIYWGDSTDFAALASGGGELPWVRAALEARYDLEALDSLAAESGSAADRFDRLIIAQPRALSPQDNVLLDKWVIGGGRLLMVIDPLLTGSYAVPLGDPSHPVAVGLLPPVLERWGIGMRYDEGQPFQLQSREVEGIELPFAMAGEIDMLDSGSGVCSISGDGLLARCNVGEGRVTLLADAALFEFDEETSDRRKSLSKLVEFAFE